MVPDGAVIECPWGGEQEHDGDQGVQDHGEDQRDQVEQGDVHEEHRDVHFRGTRMLEITFRNLDNVKINKQDHFIAVFFALTCPYPLTQLCFIVVRTSQGEE